ncbi:MAG TPA: sll0787 family AIR synthase-like protein [Thermodesulfobacteriota bacterium]
MDELISALRSSPRLTDKVNLRNLWDIIPGVCEVDGRNVILGDDAAAIETQDGYLLVAAEGVYPELLKSNPYLAGRTSVLTNVSDIYAMGGRPIAILDVLFSPNYDEVNEVLRGIKDNASRYKVPLVGGHLTRKTNFSSLSVFIIGRATRILSSFNAKTGDDLVFVCNLEGKFYSGFNFWDSSSQLSSEDALRQLEVFPRLAEEGKVDSAKDVSMAGLIGSVLMLLESSGKGAEIHIEKIPKPYDIPLREWLITFPSYGFILSIRPQYTTEVKKIFNSIKLTCRVIGKIIGGSNVLFVKNGVEKRLFWDIEVQPLIGIGKGRLKKVKNGE